VTEGDHGGKKKRKKNLPVNGHESLYLLWMDLSWKKKKKLPGALYGQATTKRSPTFLSIPPGGERKILDTAT